MFLKHQSTINQPSINHQSTINQPLIIMNDGYCSFNHFSWHFPTYQAWQKTLRTRALEEAFEPVISWCPCGSRGSWRCWPAQAAWTCFKRRENRRKIWDKYGNIENLGDMELELWEISFETTFRLLLGDILEGFWQVVQTYQLQLDCGGKPLLYGDQVLTYDSPDCWGWSMGRGNWSRWLATMKLLGRWRPKILTHLCVGQGLHRSTGGPIWLPSGTQKCFLSLYNILYCNM